MTWERREENHCNWLNTYSLLNRGSIEWLMIEFWKSFWQRTYDTFVMVCSHVFCNCWRQAYWPRCKASKITFVYCLQFFRYSSYFLYLYHFFFPKRNVKTQYFLLHVLIYINSENLSVCNQPAFFIFCLSL